MIKKINAIILIAIIILSPFYFKQKVNSAEPEPIQDRKMSIIYCSCGGGRYSYGFSCALPGNECYTSYYCFCDDVIW